MNAKLLVVVIVCLAVMSEIGYGGKHFKFTSLSTHRVSKKTPALIFGHNFCKY